MSEDIYAGAVINILSRKYVESIESHPELYCTVPVRTIVLKRFKVQDPGVDGSEGLKSESGYCVQSEHQNYQNYSSCIHFFSDCSGRRD